MPQEPFDPALIIDNNSWHEVLKFVKTCNEDEAHKLLEYEQNNQNRLPWVNRFHQRFNKLRGQRERKEIAAKS